MLSEIKSEILDWLDSIHHGGARWKYNCSMIREWGVECSTSAIGMQLKPLDSEFTAEQRTDLAQEIQCWQDPETGFFKDPLISEEDHVSDHHTWEHIWNHHTGVCTGILSRLNAAPLHPLPMQAFGMDDSMNLSEIGDWVRSLGWENAWGAGEHFSRGIKTLYQIQEQQETDTSELIDKAFITLEQDIINTGSGLPDRMNSSEPYRAMAGLFKLIFAYFEADREIPNSAQALDSTLALQEPDGGMGQDNLCIHWDAAWVIKNLNAQLQGSHRFKDIQDAGNRLAEFLKREHRKPDGGFSFHKKHCLAVHNSIQVSEPLPESDVIGTSMSCRCLSYAEEWNNGLSEPVDSFKTVNKDKK